MRRWILWCLLLALGSAMPGWAANTHNLRSEAEERAAWFGDMLQPHIVQGCVPSLPVVALTLPALACTAYVANAEGAFVYVTQAAHAIGPLDQGNGEYWLAVHRDTSSTVAGWTREPQTHYVWTKSITRPAESADRLLVAQMTVVGPSIVATAATTSPGIQGQAEVYIGAFTQALGQTSAAINAAIRSLPPTGGVVKLDRGTYLLTETIDLGTGGVDTPSLRHGIMLEGIGTASYNKAMSAVILQWATATEAPVIAVRGPLIGWGLKNLYIDGGSTASAGIYVQSGQHGDVSNVTVAGVKGNSIWSVCVPTFATWNGVTDALKNMWHNVWVWHLPPAAAGTAAVALDSTSITCNTDFNQFYQLTTVVAGVDGWNVYLGGADHNMFYNAHMIDDGMTRSNVHFAYDNAGFSGWPCGTNFYGLSLGNQGMSSSGTPLANNTCLNYIYGMSGGDPVDFIPDLPGVVVFSGRRVNQNLILVPGYNAASTQPIGHLELFTSVARPHHFIPTTDSVADLGLNLTNRFRDIYLRGQVLKTSRAISGNGTQDALNDSYIQITNVAPSSFALQTAAAPYGCNREYTIKNIGAAQVTIAAFGAELIDGSATLVLTTTPGATAVRLMSDCVNWHVVGRD